MADRLVVGCLPYRKTGLGHISTFFGPTMCMFVVFARKDGASRLIYIPKRIPTRFIPPLCFLLACFRCCLGQGESKIPPSNPHKDHAWHSTLIIQCWPYSMSRRTLKFLNAVRFGSRLCGQCALRQEVVDTMPSFCIYNAKPSACACRSTAQCR